MTNAAAEAGDRAWKIVKAEVNGGRGVETPESKALYLLASNLLDRASKLLYPCLKRTDKPAPDEEFTRSIVKSISLATNTLVKLGLSKSPSDVRKYIGDRIKDVEARSQVTLATLNETTRQVDAFKAPQSAAQTVPSVSIPPPAMSAAVPVPLGPSAASRSDYDEAKNVLLSTPAFSFWPGHSIKFSADGTMNLRADVPGYGGHAPNYGARGSWNISRDTSLHLSWDDTSNVEGWVRSYKCDLKIDKGIFRGSCSDDEWRRGFARGSERWSIISREVRLNALP